MTEVYILEKRWEEELNRERYDRSRIVGVYTSLDLAIQLSGGHDWAMVDWGEGECCAFSKGKYTEDDPEYSVYKFAVKSE